MFEHSHNANLSKENISHKLSNFSVTNDSFELRIHSTEGQNTAEYADCISMCRIHSTVKGNLLSFEVQF